MANISYDKSWRSEINSKVSAKGRLQGLNLHELNLKVNVIFEKKR